MTEYSYLWNGTINGDASEAPYCENLFNKCLSGSVLSADDGLGHMNRVAGVIPGYLNDLKVMATGNNVWGVSVSTGAAVIENYIYTVDEPVALTIDKPSNYTRFDLIVLRLDKNAQTVRAAVVKGNEDATLSREPTLTQNDSIWEYPIAKVYVPGPSFTYQYIFTGAVEDRRVFLALEDWRNKSNLLVNGEFMAYRAVGVEAPDGWSLSAVAVPVNSHPDSVNFLLQPRGRALGINGGLLLQKVPVKSTGSVFSLRGYLSVHTADSVTLEILAVDASQVSSVVTSVYLADKTPLTDTPYPYDLAILTETFSVPVGTEYLEVRYLFEGNYGLIGQQILTEGYITGPFRPFHETIPYDKPVTDVAWSSTAKSTGTTAISLGTGGSFGGVVYDKTRGILVRLRGRDSGSAAGVPYLAAMGYAAPYNSQYVSVYIEGITNDVWRDAWGVVPTLQDLIQIAGPSITPQFRLDVAATGVGTLDATVEIVGILT